jgi:TolA-binding protein
MSQRAALSIALVAVGLLAVAEGAQGAPNNKELDARVADVDAQVAALANRTNQSLVELQQQIETARQELRTLRGQIEEAAARALRRSRPASAADRERRRHRRARLERPPDGARGDVRR